MRCRDFEGLLARIVVRATVGSDQVAAGRPRVVQGYRICGDTQNLTGVEPILTEESSVSLEENKALVRRFFDHINEVLQGDPEVVRQYLAPDFVYHTAMVSSDEHHHDRLVNEGAAFSELLPSHGIEIDHMLADDELVAVHFTLRPSDDDDVTGQGIAHYRITDGKISELWIYSTIEHKIRTAASV